MKKIILGFAGEIAGGKGTAAKYLIDKYGSGSQKISIALRQNFGEDILSKVISKDVENDGHEIIAVDGVRRLSDIKYLKGLPGFRLVYIEADIGKRYERIVLRGENVDDKNKTFEEFKKDNEGETETQIKGLKEHADFMVDNNGTIGELYEKIDGIVEKCGKEK